MVQILKFFLLCIIMLFLFLLVGPIGCCLGFSISLFSNYQISGLVINTALQITLLCITLYIARLVEKNERKRHFNQFRYLAYQELCSIFKEIQYTAISFNKLRAELGLFYQHHGFLFISKSKLKSLIEKIQKEIDEFIAILEEKEEKDSSKVYLGDIEDPFLNKLVEKYGKTDSEKYTPDLKEFFSLKNELFDLVQNELFLTKQS